MPGGRCIAAADAAQVPRREIEWFGVDVCWNTAGYWAGGISRLKQGLEDLQVEAGVTTHLG